MQTLKSSVVFLKKHPFFILPSFSVQMLSNVRFLVVFLYNFVFFTCFYYETSYITGIINGTPDSANTGGITEEVRDRINDLLLR